MRTAGFWNWGGPEVIEVVDVADPEPRDGEVRIKVAAATVNPGDVELRAGTLAAMLGDVAPPYFAGMEVAGTIDAVGPGGDPAQIGDRVAAIVSFLSDGRGGHAELVVVPAASAVPVPTTLSFVEAATIPMNGLTARLALASLGLLPGETLAVTGATGAVGGYAVQMASAAGIRVVAAAAPRDEELLLGLGVDTIVPRDGDPSAEVQMVAPGGVDGLIDAARLRSAVLPAVRDGGRVVALYPFGDQVDRGITLTEVLVLQHATDQAGLRAVMKLAEEKKLRPRIAQTFRIEQAPDAFRRLEGGGLRGRLVLELDG